MSDITLTVGLPMYDAGPIAWLSLEGLCRQTGIDFAWELLIEEEQGAGAFGPAAVCAFEPRLRAAGCERLHYCGLLDRVALSQKWRSMALSASNTSRCFVVEGADNYTWPTRLREAHTGFSQGDIDWLRYEKGIFYDIGEQGCYLLDRAVNPHPAGLGIVVSTELMRQLPDEDCWRSVDRWLVESLKPRGVEINLSEGWKQGCYTTGLNIICPHRLGQMRGLSAGFSAYEGGLDMPVEVVRGLQAVAPLAREREKEWALTHN